MILRRYPALLIVPDSTEHSILNENQCKNEKNINFHRKLILRRYPALLIMPDSGGQSISMTNNEQLKKNYTFRRKLELPRYPALWKLSVFNEKSRKSDKSFIFARKCWTVGFQRKFKKTFKLLKQRKIRKSSKSPKSKKL